MTDYLAPLFAIAIVFGAGFLVILISRAYLSRIFNHFDRMATSRWNAELLPGASSWSMSVIGKVVTRAIDLTAMLLALPLLAPLFVMVALLVKIDSNGPVLFRSKRIGQFGRQFSVFKFRTMQAVDFETNIGKEEFRSLSDDPRVTSVGGFLRRTSLDELPKLFNVLLGDMSLVGTSTASDYRFLEELNEEVRTLLLSAKPGLVSLWALSGDRWASNLEARISYDVYYVSQRTLSMDMAILFLAIPSVLGRVGSY